MTAIRLAVPADVDGVLAVGRAAWPPVYTPLAGEEYVTEGLARWWTHEGTLPAIRDHRVWVADDAGDVVGMAMYGTADRVLDLWKLYVVPERQGEGIGGALLAHVLDATQEAVDRVTLAYMSGNSAAGAFYERRGFVETGREPDLLGGPESVRMVLHLRGHPVDP